MTPEFVLGPHPLKTIRCGNEPCHNTVGRGNWQDPLYCSKECQEKARRREQALKRGIPA